MVSSLRSFTKYLLISLLISLVLTFVMISRRYEVTLGSRLPQSPCHSKGPSLVEKPLFPKPTLCSHVQPNNSSPSSPPPAKLKHFVYICMVNVANLNLKALFQTFAMKNKLNMMLTGPADPDLMSTTEKEPGHYWQVGPRPKKSPDMASERGWFNKPFFIKHFPKDTVYITSLQNPITSFKNINKAGKVYKEREVDFHKVLTDDDLFYIPSDMYLTERCTNIKKLAHNQQLQWLGFDVNQSSDLASIQEHLSFLHDSFALFILAEYFDECLILLRRLLNWSFADIFYKPFAKQPRDKIEVGLTLEEKDKLLNSNHNMGDWMLYQQANRTLWEKIQREDNFNEELQDFKQENRKIIKWCRSKSIYPGARLQISTKWEPVFQIVAGDCVRLISQADMLHYHNLDLAGFAQIVQEYALAETE